MNASLLLAWLFVGFGLVSALQDATVTRLEPAATAEGVVPWIESADGDWRGQEPHFVIEEDDERIASGRFAYTNEHLLIRVVVRDRTHHQTATGAGIYSGDSIQIGIDGRGNTNAPSSGDLRLPPWVASIAVAKTPDGDQVYAHFHGRYSQGYIGSGGERDYPCTVIRDADEGTTTYELHVPWAELETPPGLFRRIGLAVQINDSDGPGGPRREYHWGRGGGGSPRPWLNNGLAMADPPATSTAAAVTRRTAYYRGDRLEAQLYANPARGASVELTVGGNSAALTLSDAQDGPARYVATVPVHDPGVHGARFSVRLLPSAAHARGAEAEGTVSAVFPVAQELSDLLLKLADEADHPLLADHFRSVRSVVMEELTCALRMAEQDPGAMEAAAQALPPMLEDFGGDAADWETYLQGKRALIHSWVSPRDRKLSFYRMYMPADWEPDAAYPLFFELHGRGNPNPINTLGRLFSPRPEDEFPPRTCPEIRRGGYAVLPFNRGNTGYTGIGEVDLWEAYDDVHDRFRIDPDRRYLFGFSMGGGGTWQIGTRTPDRWAAVGIFSGGLWRSPRGIGLGRNLLGTPVWIACGEDDRLFPQNVAMHEELTRYGVDHEWTVIPDTGHSYRMDYQEQLYDFLIRHTRSRPRKIRFVADTNEHPGAWGVTMRRDPQVSCLPSFHLVIDGSTVTLDTEGTPGVRIDLGPDGLRLEGEVTVIWNGQRAYQGPPKTINLGAGAGRRRRN